MTDESKSKNESDNPVQGRPGKWMGFTKGTSHEQARAAFKAKYKYSPELVRPAGPIILVGPIKGEEPVEAAQELAQVATQAIMTLEVTQ